MLDDLPLYKGPRYQLLLLASLTIINFKYSLGDILARMDQIVGYFRNKQNAYRLFFAQLQRVIEGVGKEYGLGIQQEYHRVMVVCSNQLDSVKLKAKVQQLKAHRYFQFNSIVDLLIIALRQIPDNMAKRQQAAPSVVFKNLLVKSIPPNEASLKHMDCTTYIHNSGQSSNKKLKQQQSIQINPNRIIQTDNIQSITLANALNESQRLKDKPEAAHLPSNEKSQHNQSYPVNKLNPKVFQLPKSISKTLIKDYQREGSLGIIEPYTNSFVATVELCSNNESDGDDKINLKTCRQFDRKIYNEANQYLQICKNRQMNKITSSPLKRYPKDNRGVDSISRLGWTETKAEQTVVQAVSNIKTAENELGNRMQD